MDINDIFSKVDSYFKKNQPKDAEKLLKETLAQAKEENNSEISLQILNELIGYYRQTSEVDYLLSVIEEALDLADKMGLKGTIPFVLPFSSTFFRITFAENNEGGRKYILSYTDCSM